MWIPQTLAQRHFLLLLVKVRHGQPKTLAVKCRDGTWKDVDPHEWLENEGWLPNETIFIDG